MTIYPKKVYFGDVWLVEFTNRARKQKGKLPVRVQETLYQLVKEIEKLGPVRGDWPNYSKLPDGRHHCHLKKGQPTYVAVWRSDAGRIKLVEVVYVGNHEKAPY